MAGKSEWHPLTPRAGEIGASELFASGPSRITLHRWARGGLFGGQVKLKLTYSGGRTGVLAADAADFEAAVNRFKRAPEVTAKEMKDFQRRQQATRRRLMLMGAIK